jgi:ankyrin repeat protein
MIELLLANGADVHKCTNMQLTALDLAAVHGNLQCAKALIAAGADVNHTCSYGRNTLHAAVITQHAAVAQLLLEHGATAVINTLVPTRYSQSARGFMQVPSLMMCEKPATAKVLLAADVHVTTDSGDTCLHMAAGHKTSAAMLCLLIKAGADLHAVDSEGRTAAQIAHERGNTLIEQLLNRAAQQQGH